MKSTRLPISALQHNLVHDFETIAKANGHSLQLSVENGIVSPEIEYILDPTTPKCPSVDLEKGLIRVHESYLAFLWAYMYSNFVIFEAGVQQRMLDGTFSGTIDFDGDLLIRAKLLGDWATRFADAYEPWDEQSLPNPKAHANDAEKLYAGKVNALFVRAVTFLLLHEYAHLLCQHSIRADDLVRREQEKEADNFAMNFLIDFSSTEKERHISGLSVVLLYSSNFLLAPNVRTIWQRHHPSVQDRLRFGLESLNLVSDKAKFYVYYLASLTLRAFLEKHGAVIEQMTENTAEDLFFRYLDLVEKLRQDGI